MTQEIVAIVEDGQIKLPPHVRLPDGVTVRVIWDEADQRGTAPYDREMLTEEDVKADLDWATGRRFPS
jgi:hypothetical protein